MLDLIEDILVKRDGMTKDDAQALVAAARTDLYERLGRGEMPEDICEEWFGLEPDYIDQLM